ncbi:MAG: hypothetical protein WD751_04640 [Anaerolineales bacterium]
MIRGWFVVVILISVAFLFAACQSGNPEETTPAAKALVAYLNALVAKDEAGLTLLSCADWEANALLELDSFQSVETHLEGLSCQQTASTEGSATVICQGAIVTSYGDEVQEFDLSERTYRLVQQGSDWLVCGY